MRGNPNRGFRQAPTKPFPPADPNAKTQDEQLDDLDRQTSEHARLGPALPLRKPRSPSQQDADAGLYDPQPADRSDLGGGPLSEV